VNAPVLRNTQAYRYVKINKMRIIMLRKL